MPPRKKKKPKGEVDAVQAMRQIRGGDGSGGDENEEQTSGRQPEVKEERESRQRADRAKAEEHQQYENEGREIRRRADREKAEERRQRQAQTAKDLMEMIAVPEGMVRYGPGDDAVFPGPWVRSIRRVKEMWVDALRRSAGCREDGEEEEEAEGKERGGDGAERLHDSREASEVEGGTKLGVNDREDGGDEGEKALGESKGENSTHDHSPLGSSDNKASPSPSTLRDVRTSLRKRPRRDHAVSPEAASLPAAPTPHANHSQVVQVDRDLPLSSNRLTDVLGPTNNHTPIFDGRALPSAQEESTSSATEQGTGSTQHDLALISDQAHMATAQTTSTRATTPARSRPSALPSQFAPVHAYTDQLAYHNPSDMAHAVFAPAYDAMPPHSCNQTSTGAFNRPDYHAAPYNRNHHNKPPPYLPMYHFNQPPGHAPLDIARPSGMYTLDTYRPIDIAPSNQLSAPWPDGYPLPPLYTPCYYTTPLLMEGLSAPASAAPAPPAAYAFPPTPPPDNAGAGTTGINCPMPLRVDRMTTMTTTTQPKDTCAGQWADAWAASGGFDPSVALPLSASSSSSSSLDVLLFSDTTGKNGRNTSASPP